METTIDLTVEAAFDAFQKVVDADPELVACARERREIFRKAFVSEPDVTEFVASGSLERRTQRDPMNDVDVIVVYKAGDHPDWGADGDSSAEVALNHAREQVKRLLNDSDGEAAQLVRLTRVRNHAVKCFVDDPDDPDALTVDVMPALRQEDGKLRVPEIATNSWIETDPEHLIREVNDRQENWESFVPLVRDLKFWAEKAGTGMKSLVVEVLALAHLPEETTRARALQRFFTAAELAIEEPICDPAGLCGEIQPDLDRDAARDALTSAASDSWKALAAEDSGDDSAAICYWHQVFGDDFPQPPGGCALDTNDDDARLAGRSIAIGGLGAPASHEPRPIVDAPQG